MITPRPEIRQTELAEHGGRYGAAETLAEVSLVRHDFSVCLNAFGPADIVTRAVREASFVEYPDPFSRAAREAAAERWGCASSEIAFGAGAAELIHAVCFAYLRRGDHVIVAQPAFGEYARAVSLMGARVRPIQVDDERGTITVLSAFTREIEHMRPRMVFLAAPVSPTGAAITSEAIRETADACSRAGALLILDQAYDAFSAAPLGTPALRGHENVLHVRSLTKDHALAGLRVAFAVGAPAVISALERARIPWSASAPAQAAAVASLSDEATAHVAHMTAMLRREARRIAARCAELGITVRESTTHYMLIHAGNAHVARQRLLEEHRVLVRDCTSFGLPEWIRIAARIPRENDVLVTALPTLRDVSRAAMPALQTTTK